MRSSLLVLIIWLPSILVAQNTKFDPDKKYHPDSLKRWMRSVFDGISIKHPGFYRYTSKGKFDNLIDSTVLTISDSLTELEFYRKLKPLFAQVGCLHTGISLSSDYNTYLDGTATLIPLDVFIDNDRKVRVTKTYTANSGVAVGSRIVSINGRPTSEILPRLLHAIPSDGFNQTEKILLLNHRFAFWYQTVIEVTDKFLVEIDHDGVTESIELKGVSAETFPSQKSLEHNYKKPLEFQKQNDLGILKIHTFAKSTIKPSKQNFRKFTRQTFREIRDSGIRNLILDVRDNSGGTDGNAVFLASYFFDKPFRYWDKIEVTEAISEEIKGIHRLFYKKPKKVDGTYRWRKTWVTSEFDYYETQKPAKNNFKGKTYIMTNGLCLSSCADFVAILSHNGKALVVGQETGGGYQGNNSGMMPHANIPTGLRVGVPLQKYTNAVDLAKNYGRGTIPDFEVPLTFENWVNGKDEEMDFVKSLVEKK